MSLRAGVVGVGHLGRHHARIYGQMDGVDLVAVADHDQERAKQVAEPYGATVFPSHVEFPELDLVSVAVPTVDHAEVATHFLERKVPVLVEKPMTATLEEARALTALAERQQTPLQVGHVERFHPALRAGKRLGLEPMFIEAHRLAPFSFRSTDIGVVLDLMIHDLDLVLHLVNSPLKQVHASGGTLLSSSEDIASARLEFENGAVANLTASRISLKTMRRMRIFSSTMFVSLDFDKKYAFYARKGEGFDEKVASKKELLTGKSGDQMSSLAALAFQDLIEIQELDLDEVEPLQAELSAFVHSVQSGERPEVPGEEALAALEAAAQVRQQIEQGGW